MTAKRATNGNVTGSGVSCRSGDKLAFTNSVSGEGCIVDEVSEVRLFSSGTIKKVCWAITVGPRELDEETYATYSPGYTSRNTVVRCSTSVYISHWAGRIFADQMPVPFPTDWMDAFVIYMDDQRPAGLNAHHSISRSPQTPIYFNAGKPSDQV